MSKQYSPTVEELLDIEAIKRLKAMYCKYADSGNHAVEFASLFTRNAVLDEGDDGVFEGRSNIMKMYETLWPYLKLNQHLVFSPIIEINGSTASGEWKLLQLSTTVHDEGEKAFWSCGYYKDKYVKSDQRWQFDRVEARVHFCSEYSEGWAKQPWGEFLPPAAVAALSM